MTKKKNKKKEIFKYVSKDHDVYTVSPKSLVNRNILFWFAKRNPKITTSEIISILKEFNIEIGLHEKISHQQFQKYKSQFSKIDKKYFSNVKSNLNLKKRTKLSTSPNIKSSSIFEKVSDNPFFRYKFQNPSRCKEGNYFKLIYIRKK